MKYPDYIYVKTFEHTVVKAVYNEDKKGYIIPDRFFGCSFADMTCKENIKNLKDFEAGKAYTTLIFKEPNVDTTFTFEYEVFLDPWKLALKPTYTL